MALWIARMIQTRKTITTIFAIISRSLWVFVRANSSSLTELMIFSRCSTRPPVVYATDIMHRISVSRCAARVMRFCCRWRRRSTQPMCRITTKIRATMSRHTIWSYRYRRAVATNAIQWLTKATVVAGHHRLYPTKVPLCWIRAKTIASPARTPSSAIDRIQIHREICDSIWMHWASHESRRAHRRMHCLQQPMLGDWRTEVVIVAEPVLAVRLVDAPETWPTFLHCQSKCCSPYSPIWTTCRCAMWARCANDGAKYWTCTRRNRCGRNTPNKDGHCFSPYLVCRIGSM